MENWERGESNTVPPGFRFLPTHEELIKEFLWNKSMGLPLPHNHPVLEIDHIYGENKTPSEVFKDVVFDDHSEIYVLTRLSKISKGKTRIARTAGNGSWEGQTSSKPIMSSDGQKIGSWKMFCYEENVHHWIMHEFSLDGVFLDYDFIFKDYVICKIKRKLVNSKSSTENKKRSIVSYNKKQRVDHDVDDDDDGNKSMDSHLGSVRRYTENKKRSAVEEGGAIVSYDKKQRVDDHDVDDDDDGNKSMLGSSYNNESQQSDSHNLDWPSLIERALNTDDATWNDFLNALGK